ncbi:MAG: efflux RND transporter periplasmic adaptor subunit [Pseudomonadota bacterium]
MLWLARAFSIVLLIALGGAALAQPRAAGVGTQLVTTRQTADTVSVFGQVVAGRESAVAARVSGVADDVPLRVGDRVQEGDLLVRLDSELLQIEMAAAEAEIGIAEAGVEVTRARLERAEKALRRAESLRANSTIAEAQLEDRVSEYAEAVATRQQAQARITAARSALERARYNLDNATVRAPFDGVVLAVPAEIGQFINAGSEVARLVDVGSMEIEANVPARYISALTSMGGVEAVTDAGGGLALSMRAILPTEYSATRTRPVRFDILGGGELAAVGQSVTLQVPVSAPREVVAVPKDALVQARGGWSVFVHMEGKAVPRPVEIGVPLGDTFEVVRGLAPGDEVIVRGNERLRPGQDIAPQRVDAQATGQGQGAPAASGGAQAGARQVAN